MWERLELNYCGQSPSAGGRANNIYDMSLSLLTINLFDHSNS